MLKLIKALGSLVHLLFLFQVRLKERLELLDTLRQVPETLQDEDWDTLGLALHHGHDMPTWWEAGYHDNSLVKVANESLFIYLKLSDLRHNDRHGGINLEVFHYWVYVELDD